MNSFHAFQHTSLSWNHFKMHLKTPVLPAFCFCTSRGTYSTYPCPSQFIASTEEDYPYTGGANWDWDIQFHACKQNSYESEKRMAWSDEAGLCRVSSKRIFSKLISFNTLSADHLTWPPSIPSLQFNSNQHLYIINDNQYRGYSLHKPLSSTPIPHIGLIAA